MPCGGRGLHPREGRDILTGQSPPGELGSNHPPQTIMQMQFEQLVQVKFAMDVQLQDPRLLTLAFRFYNLLCDVCLKVARGDAASSATYVTHIVATAAPKTGACHLTSYVPSTSSTHNSPGSQVAPARNCDASVHVAARQTVNHKRASTSFSQRCCNAE